MDMYTAGTNYKSSEGTWIYGIDVGKEKNLIEVKGDFKLRDLVVKLLRKDEVCSAIQD